VTAVPHGLPGQTHPHWPSDPFVFSALTPGWRQAANPLGDNLHAAPMTSCECPGNLRTLIPMSRTYSNGGKAGSQLPVCACKPPRTGEVEVARVRNRPATRQIQCSCLQLDNRCLCHSQFHRRRRAPRIERERCHRRVLDLPPEQRIRWDPMLGRVRRSGTVRRRRFNARAGTWDSIILSRCNEM
jgi:hypothetical protein